MADKSNSGNVPTRPELWVPTLNAIRSLGGTASHKKISDSVISELGLSPPLPGQLWHHLFWARMDLKKCGQIENLGKGVWSLTEKGREIDIPSLSEAAITPIQPKPDASVKTAAWRKHLSRTLLGMSPKAFERLCQEVLRQSGLIEVRLTGRPGDDGIDGRAIFRLAGLLSVPVLFQCKRHTGNVSSSAVRDFRGAMLGKSDYGLIFTTGGFTKNARREATKVGASPVDLIDGEMLMDKLNELELGVMTKADGVVEIDTKWFESI